MRSPKLLRLNESTKYPSQVDKPSEYHAESDQENTDCPHKSGKFLVLKGVTDPEESPTDPGPERTHRFLVCTEQDGADNSGKNANDQFN